MSPKIKTKKNILVYVMSLPPGAMESIRKYEKEVGEKFRIMLLWDSRVKIDKKLKIFNYEYENYLLPDWQSVKATSIK